MLDKSFELEQGSFLYSSGGGLFVLLGLDYSYTDVKNIKEFLSKTNYLNEKSVAKVLNRQKFICLYVCSIEMLDDDAHIKKGTIRKELNLKNLGLYKNNEIY